MSAETKRQNFNITPEQDAELAWLREAIGASSGKDVVLRAIRLFSVLVREARRGHMLYLKTDRGDLTRLLIPELEASQDGPWKYLVARPHPWRRQFYIKGRRLLASTVWRDMLANGLSAEEAAQNWDLPVDAIGEIVGYCQEHEELLNMEAQEERMRLEDVNSSTDSAPRTDP